MTSSAPRAYGLDTLRTMAILSVMVFHLLVFHGGALGGAGTIPELLVPAARLGWMGVDLFFVLSGYLIASQLLRPCLAGERAGLLGFYRNRLYRILPVYLVVLALYFLLPGWAEDAGLSPLWHYLTFTWNLLADYGVNQGFSHVWSLCIEEHFYLLLPLAIVLMMRRPSMRRTVLLLASLLIIGIGVRTFFLFHALRPLAQAGQPFGLVYVERIYFPTYSHFDGLLAGVTLALVRAFRPALWRFLAQRGHTLFLLGLVLVGLAMYLCKDRFQSASGAAAVGVALGFPVLSLGFGLWVASALSNNGFLRLKLPGAKLIATLAYCLYLTHKALIHLVDRLSPAIAETSRWQWLGLYAACCFAVAALLHLSVERPFLLLRDKRSKAR